MLKIGHIVNENANLTGKFCGLGMQSFHNMAF